MSVKPLSRVPESEAPCRGLCQAGGGGGLLSRPRGVLTAGCRCPGVRPGTVPGPGDAGSPGQALLRAPAASLCGVRCAGTGQGRAAPVWRSSRCWQSCVWCLSLEPSEKT